MNQLISIFKRFIMRGRSAFNWQVVGNNHHLGIGLFLRVFRFLEGRVTLSYVRYVSAFVRYCFAIRRKTNSTGLAIRLKASSLAVMKVVAGSPLHDTRPLGVAVELTHGGIPRWIPVSVRRSIRDQDPTWVRLVLTTCALYRVLDYQGRYSVKTIVSPGPEFPDLLADIKSFVPVFFKDLTIFLPGNFRFQLPDWEGIPILKSAPGTSSKSVVQTSVSALLRHVTLISTNSLLRESLFGAIGFCNGPVGTFRTLEGLSQMAGRYSSLFQPGLCRVKFARRATWVKEEGRLGLKMEPGKVRVFAMVDWWTQMALRPLHLFVFSILRKIPQDGTFDQEGLVRRLRQRISERGRHDTANRWPCTVYSLDLSAATDRLPVVMQVPIVDFMFPGLGQHWRNLLVGRSYYAPRHKLVRYAVGQPMGALSSWAMLALSHHFIVQFAACKAGYRGWFPDYGILGDDVVILDRSVAKSYLKIIEAIGVGINMAKSLISPWGYFEFAKKFASPTHILSGVSLSEVAVAGGSLAAFRELSKRYSVIPSWAAFLSFFGKGPFAISRMDQPFHKLSKSMRYLVIWASQPILGYEFSASSWSQWFNLLARGQFSTRKNWLGVLGQLREYVRDRVPAHEDALEEIDLGSMLFTEPLKDDEPIFPQYDDQSQDDVFIKAIESLFPNGMKYCGFTTSFPFWSLEGGENRASRVDHSVARALQFLGENTPMEPWAMSEEAQLGAMAIRPSDEPDSIASEWGFLKRNRYSLGAWIHLWEKSQVGSTPASAVAPTVADLLSGAAGAQAPLFHMSGPGVRATAGDLISSLIDSFRDTMERDKPGEDEE